MGTDPILEHREKPCRISKVVGSDAKMEGRGGVWSGGGCQFFSQDRLAGRRLCADNVDRGIGGIAAISLPGGHADEEDSSGNIDLDPH